jgi:hypothetical protein
MQKHGSGCHNAHNPNAICIVRLAKSDAVSLFSMLLLGFDGCCGAVPRLRRSLEASTIFERNWQELLRGSSLAWDIFSMLASLIQIVSLTTLCF